jgi:protein involved in polysaccharide export with SLBB domain
MPTSCRHRFRFLLGIALAAFVVTASAQDSAYHLFAGDSLAISVYSHPDLSGVYPLDEQGRLIFPLIGPMPASGQTVDEVGAALSELLKERVDGKIELIVRVAEYRPVYIDGDVVSPGAYPYRPGMTVSIAVTRAGGRQSVRTSGSLPGLSHEQEQFERLLDTYRVNVAREARLLAEIDGKKSASFPEDLEALANDRPRVREILDNERTLMDSRLKLQAIETDALNQRIAGMEQVIRELESQKESIVSRRKLYEEQFEIIRKIAGQGIVPKATLLRLEITANSLDQEARAAEITLIQTRQSLKAARAQLDNLPVERKAAATTRLQEVQNDLAQSRIQFDQSSRRLAALNSQAPPEMITGDDQAPPAVSISRPGKIDGESTSVITGGWETTVLPGDMIRIPYPEFTAPDAFDSGLPRRLKPPQN